MSLSDRLNSPDGATPGGSETEVPARARPAVGDPTGVGKEVPPTPRRRASDRTTSNDLWSQSKAKVQSKVLAEIAPRAANLSP